MALNKFMHPRNPYKTRKPDFQELAEKYAYFKEKVTKNSSGKVILDFKDPGSLRALTQALLENDFGLKVTLPLDRLIPTIPQRLNYILWLEDMVGGNQPAKGIDIGTGSSCIYPLLGCRQNGWQFLASEVDDQNVFFAEKNIQQNNMSDKVEIKKVSEDCLLQGLLEDNIETFDFSMCNPPFYSDHLEAQGLTASRSVNRPEPKSMSTASEEEGVAWGGEVRFVTQMIEESLQLQNRIRVYTSLLGKKNSLHALKEVLHKHKIENYSTTEFCQGRTMRWGIAWTFDKSVVFPKSAFKEQKKSNTPLVFDIVRGAGMVEEYTVPAYTWFLRKHVEDLQIRYFTKHSGKFYTCLVLQAKTNTWSHQRRKRRQRSKQDSGYETSVNTSSEDANKTDVAEVNNDVDQKEVVAVGNINNKNDGDDRICEGEVKGHKDNREMNDSTVCTEKEVDSQIGKNNQQNKVSNESNNEGVVADGQLISNGDNSNPSAEMSSSKRELDEGAVGTAKRIKLDSVEKASGTLLGQETSTAGNSGENSSEQSEKSSTETDNSMPPRKQIIEQFWNEMEQNKKGNKKKLSFYETLEPFSETEECLVLCKLVIRKDEGKMSLSLTHVAGSKESMHQIMQYIKNVLSQKLDSKT